MAPSWLPLPSLLPSNLQKRLLSYALTHVLGTFLEPQTFSLENLELQLLNGSVALRNLELSAGKINTLLKLPGIEIIKGHVGEVSLQVPVRDVLSGNISIKIRGIQVFVRPCGQIEPVPDFTADSLAQSFLQSSIHDPSDSVLLDTLSQSIHSSQELGIGPAEEEGIFTNVLASFVDALKARLAIEIDDLTIHVQQARSGAFILSLTRIAFLPREDKLSEKILSVCGIEAFLRNDVDVNDNASESSVSTATTPSPSHQRNLSPGDHGLSESMMFSPEEAQSLYMSAYSQPAASAYMSVSQSPSGPQSPMDEPSPSHSNDKLFRFFYFEQDIQFHVITSQPDSPEATSTRRQRPAPALKSAIPTAHLILNPQVNLLPSISIIATILSLSPTDSPQAASSDDTGGVDFSWLGGVIVHFGSEAEETIARFADWKVTKKPGEDNLSILIGQAEVVSPTGEKILSLNDPKKSGRMSILLLPDIIRISLPEVNFRIDLESLGSLQPLVQAMKQAWLESVEQPPQQPPAPEEPEDEEWNENLLVENVGQSIPQRKPLRVCIDRISITLQTEDRVIHFAIDSIDARVQPDSNSLEFTNATISLPSSRQPILTINRLPSDVSTISFVILEDHARPGFLVNGAHEILDDFLVGEQSRSDDAWGMIRADAASNSDMFIKVKIPRLDIQVLGVKEINAIKKVLAQVQKTIMLFLDDRDPMKQQPEKGNIQMVMEFGFNEGRVEITLDEHEIFEARWEDVEGTIVKGIVDGETVGVIDISRVRIDVTSPDSQQPILDESIRKANDSTPCVGVRFVHSQQGQVTSRLNLFNLNFEYHVFNPWLEKLGEIFSQTAPAGSISQVNLASPESLATSSLLPLPAQLNTSLTDCTIGLNPLDLPSRGLLLITSTIIRGEWDFRDGGRGKFDVSVNKAHLFCVDDAANLITATLARTRTSGRKGILNYFSDIGYVLCATMPTGNATVRFLLVDARAEINVEDVGIQLDTCADSTQTLGDLFNCLKPPIEIDEGYFRPVWTDGRRYRSGNPEGINVMVEIDENAFSGNFNVVRGAMSLEEDLVNDDVPFNLAFVESYYGDQSKIKTSLSGSRDGLDVAEAHGDELLAEGDDIGHFAEPPKPAVPVEKGTFGEFEEQIRVFKKPNTSENVSSSIRFVDEHFPTHSVLQENAFLSSDSVVKLKLRNTRVVWNLHDGYDWPRTRDAIALAVQKVEQKAADAVAARARRKSPKPTRAVTLPEVLYGKEPYAFDEDDNDDSDDDSEIGDILFNSIYVGVRRGQDPKSLARNINRDLDAQSETASQVSTSPSGPVRSFHGASQGYMSANPIDRTRRPSKSLRLKRSRAHKVQINLRSLGLDFDLHSEPTEPGRTDLSTLRLKVGDLEILDNVPTSSWNKFVTYWHGGDKRRRETASPMVDLEVVNVKPVHRLSASELIVKAKVLPLKLHVDQDTLDFITRFFEFKDQSALPASGVIPEPPFLQRVEVFPVNVMLDYKPKKVDYAGLRSGRTTEFMNFFTLEEAEILLRHITLYGISGYPKLFQKLNDFWMPDIRGTQLLDVLGGINYVRPFANIGGGVKDLIVVPMKEYQKDGRILKASGKGMITFGKTFANEIVKVGAKMAIGAQKGLEWGEGLLEGRQPTGREGVRFDDDDDSDFEGDPRIVTLSPYADQPANIKQGIKRAIETLVRNAKAAGETVIAIPQEVAESGSAAGAGKTVLKAIPVAIIRPLIGASGAVSNTLMGIHNTLDSNHQRNIEDKYKR